MKVLILNGANLNLLGRREPDIYGQRSLADLQDELVQYSLVINTKNQERKLEILFEQTNDEAAFMGFLSTEVDAFIINPGAWTHTSLAIADRVAALDVPVVEVHLTHTLNREPVRQRSLIAPYVKGTIMGFGFDSYKIALQYIGDTQLGLYRP